MAVQIEPEYAGKQTRINQARLGAFLALFFAGLFPNNTKAESIKKPFESVNEVRKAANQGNADAQFNV